MNRQHTCTILRGSIGGWVVTMLLSGAGTYAQGTAQVERTFDFVERSAEATEWFNAERTEEALAVFQALLADYRDLDEDGYVAMSVGDCLLALGRTEEARRAYTAALGAHPELGERLSGRLAELDLSGPVTEDTLARLRAAAAQTGTDQWAASWRLARALQKRALQLITESVEAFRTAIGSDPKAATYRQGFLDSHVTHLADLASDLKGVVEQSEAMLRIRMPKKALDGGQDDSSDEEFVVERLSIEQVLRTTDGKRRAFELRRQNGECSYPILLDGKPLTLTPEQRRLIEHHQQRINSVLLEAAGAESNRVAK